MDRRGSYRRGVAAALAQPTLPLDHVPERHREADSTYRAVMVLRRLGYRVYRAGRDHKVLHSKDAGHPRLLNTQQLQRMSRALGAPPGAD